MINTNPIEQIKLFGLARYIDEIINLEKINKLPNKILLSGQKGIGKSTLAYHFINYSLSKNERFNYNIKNYEINPDNTTFKTMLNKSNPNFVLVDIDDDKKFIDIKQVRDLTLTLTKFSFNEKPRYILIDNVESLNRNSTNALLKIIEEPPLNTYFFLIHDISKKILPTLSSRCINFKISLSNKEILNIANNLLDNKLYEIINEDLIDYYLTPGKIYILAQFGKIFDYDLRNLNIRSFLKIFITSKHYKKSDKMKNIIFDLVESYLRKITNNFRLDIFDQCEYFLKRISDTRRFNLDEESLFIEFEKKILNG